MQGLILAAGRGSRLGGGSKPKCLYRVAGRSLLERQLAALSAFEVRSVVVVAGFEHRKVVQAVGEAATVIVNERFADTNSLYSFALAKEAICDDVVVLNCDVLFHPSIVGRLCARPGSALAYDSDSGHEDEHMKVAHSDGRLAEMRKDLPPSLCRGENLGLLKLSRRAARDAFAAADALVRSGCEKDWLGAAVNVVARWHHVACVDVAGTPWVEVDFPEDLKRARVEVWPRIRDHVFPPSFRPVAFEAAGTRRLAAALGLATVGAAA